MTSLTAKDKETVRAFWAKVSGKAEDIGKDALNRLLIVYPWTQRHFTTFGNVSTNAAILGNPKVAQHGKTVMGGLENAVKNLDDIKNTYAKLSRMHSEKLHVDPDNFRLLIFHNQLLVFFSIFVSTYRVLHHARRPTG
uniref:Hemoglobin subunit epsilon 1 n=1 Tax=Seriola lalandi dorsalis TaxID=1841481 RepID=A0A3B4XLG8_SERLL